MRAFRRGVAVVLLVAAALAATTHLQAQNPSTQIQIAINNLTTGVTTFVRARFNPGGYILWGSGMDAAGYGIRDNNGTIQWKNSDGDWANIGTGGGGGGAPTDASYWTRTAESGLSNESALGFLATGIVKNTTVTGVPSIAVATDIIALWTGTCNGTTVLAGNGTCIGTSGGAPSTSTYLTQVPDAGLSGEQALSLLSTGVLKSTTGTGVVSLAASTDIIALWTGVCDGTTVLAGNGTCVGTSGGAPSTATYITQVSEAGLSAEQALAGLATGLLKNTTTTGVLSAAAVGDLIAYWSGTCNATAALGGTGACFQVAPVDASYWVSTANGTLSGETVMGALATGLVKNTTTTGVPSIAVATDIVGLWTGTCNGTTVLAGNGTCIAATGGAPTDGTYLTQIPNGSLSAEQALSLLTTGLMKVTTTTGVVSTATVTDVTGLFTGTCNVTTVLAGNGTCVTPPGGAPTTATYWVRTADGTLSNESVMGVLATGLVKNTTTTGVPSIAVVADILGLFTGTCNGTTVLAGNGTCITVTGGSGAPTTATYLTQIPDAGLSAEQALSLLATGLMKVTTTTGVVSAASITDILGYFTGTCNAGTLLSGAGTCVAPPATGAPTNATYLTQTVNATLTNEQALSLLSTGLMKVTTTTGVVSTAAVGDILGYFTGTCNATTVLTGSGACTALSAAFSVITSGTNTAAAMIVGSGATLSATGTGTITATSLAVGGITGLGTGVATWLATPSSANLRGAISDETGTGLAMFNDSPLFADDFDLVTAGVRFSAADGVLTLLGLGNGADENLTLDFDNAGANQVNIATGTGVTQVNWSMTLKAGGYQSSDGTVGLTQTCVAAVTAVTVKNGLITAITCP